ncbi:DNA double-strand break repair nuclease NurA [Candidatus Babeliales bacterium]|nr:DNA double-strand break repair nuclease NurA [Candidatus Babeliales bacterium]MBP9843768.1 DNA double-strand break repair nuclease NurA [Candidatus Babeliales bacterium]
MLDRSKIVAALQKVSTDLFIGFAQEIDIARQVWMKISMDQDFDKKIQKTKQPLLVPGWQGLLSPVVSIIPCKDNYAVVAVDGSQIYYDKHQGPPCFLINIGFIQLRYGLVGKSIQCGSQPFLTTKLDAENDFGSQDFVNMQREKDEFDLALEHMLHIKLQAPQALSVCLFDGSLIFFHLDAQDMEFKELFLDKYCQILEQFYQNNMLIAGYMSLPRTKELVNLCKLELSQFDEENLGHTSVIDRLTDVDIVDLYIKPYQRSIVFKSRAPISFLYPSHLQPYFCYLHVGSEIARIEFPAWIAKSAELVDQVCSIALDQALKGRGYPVCLFEAHEQAVIKSVDRDFFYVMLEKLSHRQSKNYIISQKSIKKQQPIL